LGGRIDIKDDGGRRCEYKRENLVVRYFLGIFRFERGYER
jgi:hypothetical protein